MAVKTIREIYARIENIQQFPYIGADLAKRVSFRTDDKYVICGNYVVLYKSGKEYVEICQQIAAISKEEANHLANKYAREYKKRRLPRQAILVERGSPVICF